MGFEKIAIGAILVIGSLYYIGTNMFGALDDLVVVINGALPLLVLVFGALIVWLQLDQMLMERKVKGKK
ncbi:hypothetical protein EPN87_02745 [archaeon]|nr:MAG: hypothetical protein EPN87_02745 [archaeon]